MFLVQLELCATTVVVVLLLSAGMSTIKVKHNTKQPRANNTHSGMESDAKSRARTGEAQQQGQVTALKVGNAMYEMRRMSTI